ncbi:MAG TPA: flagellar export chaperone FliS [Defluviitaleaceae bacterium]|nr:flagellar export chaperone FliS [Candidatus Epulonipiscium sp.]HOQ17432.1 flagellar export chaperone FliS [Defluviitaleaceae bacterium]HPT76540.1 flagellar export chaperone FliS [Defluviitaleaceae bacterium]HQD49571.1 flagellar export chaperone FliS [Defluviitaleaceae bacterium]
MTQQNAYNNYRNNVIMTASPQELTLMLYDGALKFCRQAMLAIDEGKIKEAHEYIVRVEDIIEEFQATLDKKYEISSSLDLLYDYIYRRLVEANVQKDKAILEEVYGLIKELRDTWKEAMKLSKVKK